VDYTEKLGFHVKNLSSNFSSMRQPLELQNVVYYRQPSTTQPTARVFGVGEEYVELVTAGRGWVIHKDEWREVRPGDLIWNRRGDSTIGKSDPANPYECLAVEFRVRAIVQAKGNSCPARFSIWADQQAVERFASEASRLFLDSRFDRAVLLQYLHGVLIFQVHCHAASVRSNRYSPGVRAVLDWMESEFSEDITIAGMARKAGWSEPHFHEMFRTEVGFSPHQWLLQKRINFARERLLNSHDSIKETAHHCGFQSSASFIHAFKKMAGTTPGEFRRIYRGGN